MSPQISPRTVSVLCSLPHPGRVRSSALTGPHLRTSRWGGRIGACSALASGSSLCDSSAFGRARGAFAGLGFGVFTTTWIASSISDM